MNYDDGTLDSGQVAALLPLWLAFFVFYIVIFVAAYVVMSIALMTFFRKVGVDGWIAWVPFYNTWKWLEIGGQRGWIALVALIPGASLIASVFLWIGMYRSGLAFGKGVGFLVLGIFLPFVWAFILGSRSEVYDPARITAAGYPAPLAGHGAVPRPDGMF
jgi:Family of unknown function (DUF5684)